MMRTIVIPSLMLLICTATTHAADVIKIKGASALIDLKGEPAAPGDLFYAISADGKKRGIIQITKIKGDKALGHLNKGRAEPGMTLEPKAPGGGSPVARERKSGGATGTMYWGGMLGYAMDSAQVKVYNTGTSVERENASLSGNGITAMGLFDYGFSPNLWIRALAGLENFNVKGPASCGIANAETCDAKIMYLSGSAAARWLFMTGNIRPWVGAGVSIMFPVTKSSTAFDSSSIGSTQVILAQGGVDWFINPNMYIPISLEYGLLPKSAQVQASWMELRFGIAVPF